MVNGDMKVLVTTTRQPTATLEQTGRKIAGYLNGQFAARKKLSLLSLKTVYPAAIILVVNPNGLVVHTPGGEFFFHLSMAELRIKNLINGKDDHMVYAMDLQPGRTVLDCTLGLATDALVASFVVGDTGRVTGLEISPLIALVVKQGLKNFSGEPRLFREARRRIEVYNTDYFSFLTGLADKSFDIVYFDPMFRLPVYSSSSIKPLRYLADDRPLAPAAIREAQRVAKRRIVVKDSHNGNTLESLGITEISGGKYSRVRYGIITR